jgi:hypothetical protein
MAGGGSIPGVSRTSLWTAWKSVRRELRNCSVRDVADFIEYDINPEVWINRLLDRIRAGTYEPQQPRRYYIAKSTGFSRQMTLPLIPDLVLYRAIVDHIYARSRYREHKHVYFERKALAIATRAAAEEAAVTISKAAEYSKATHRFLTWLRYNQYRKHLVLSRVYAAIVCTDITNFFDSILYSQIDSALRVAFLNPRLVGLLFFLLERFSPRQSFSESPRIGLPVDEFDCSRKLAHMVLFPHDDRMVKLVGEDSYVRWMDDQNFGVGSRAEALRLLGNVGRSLATHHLTANSGKSKILSIADARRYFHLDTNAALDKLDDMPTGSGRERQQFARQLRAVWESALRREGHGHWDKVLKRFYSLAGRCESRLLRRRATRDLLCHPSLAERIIDYIRCTGSPHDHIDFVERIFGTPEQVYGDVNVVLCESLLRLEPAKEGIERIRNLALEMLGGKREFPGSVDCAAMAPLLILRFADRRTIRLLRRCFEKKPHSKVPASARAAAIVYASAGDTELDVVKRTAGQLRHNYLSELVELFDRVAEYKTVPDRYHVRIKVDFDAMTRREYIDMRGVVAARILSFCPAKKVQQWLAAKRDVLLSRNISDFDRSLIRRTFNPTRPSALSVRGIKLVPKTRSRHSRSRTAVS